MICDFRHILASTRNLKNENRSCSVEQFSRRVSGHRMKIRRTCSHIATCRFSVRAINLADHPAQTQASRERFKYTRKYARAKLNTRVRYALERCVRAERRIFVPFRCVRVFI